MTINTDNLKKIQDAFHKFQDECRMVMVDDDCDEQVADAIKTMLQMTTDGLDDVDHYSKDADTFEDDEPEYERTTGHEMGTNPGRV